MARGQVRVGTGLGYRSRNGGRVSRAASRSDLAALALLVVFGLLVLQPVLHAEFVLVDDHEILWLTGPASGPPFDQLESILFRSDPGQGRFRPLAWIVRLGQATLLSDRPAAWHASVLGLGLISAGLLYATWRSLRIEPLPALLLAAWLLVAPGVSSNWIRIGTNETTGAPLFGLALFAAAQAAAWRPARFWDAVFVVASLGAMLSKESFSLAAPALAGFRLLANSVVGSPQRQAGPVSAALVLAGGVTIGLVDFAVVANAGSQSYAGGFLSSTTVGTYALNVLHNLVVIGFASCGWLVPLIVWAGRTALVGRERRLAALATALALLLVLPQLLLYSRQGVFEGKYELPAVIGLGGWIIAGLAWLRHRAPRAYLAGVLCWAAALCGFAFSTWSYATYFTEDSLELQLLVSDVASSASQGAFVGIAGDPAADNEPMLSLVDHLNHAGRADLQIKALVLTPPGPYTPQEARLAESLLNTSLGLPNPLHAGYCSLLAAVIVLRDEDAARRALPCLTDFERLDLSEQVVLWGGDQVSLQPRLPGPARPGYLLYMPRRSR